MKFHNYIIEKSKKNLIDVESESVAKEILKKKGLKWDKAETGTLTKGTLFTLKKKGVAYWDKPTKKLEIY